MAPINSNNHDYSHVEPYAEPYVEPDAGPLLDDDDGDEQYPPLELRVGSCYRALQLYLS